MEKESNTRYIDGEKFIAMVGFGGMGMNSLTAELLRDRLAEIGIEETERILSMCEVKVNDRTAMIYPEISKSLMEPSLSIVDSKNDNFYFDSPAEIKKRLRHAKNPMERMKLQRKLNEVYIYLKRKW